MVCFSRVFHLPGWNKMELHKKPVTTHLNSDSSCQQTQLDVSQVFLCDLLDWEEDVYNWVLSKAIVQYENPSSPSVSSSPLERTHHSKCDYESTSSSDPLTSPLPPVESKSLTPRTCVDLIPTAPDSQSYTRTSFVSEEHFTV